MIVCGVDDSAPALRAARAAAALAKRTGEDLQLVHVQDILLLDASVESDGTTAVAFASQQLLDAQRVYLGQMLEPLRAQLAREFEIEVELRFELGLPDAVLVRCAEEADASLIVVGAVGRRSGSMWRLGSIPDRLSQTSPMPLLVLRDAEAFSRWALEARPLRVVVALGADPSSQRAVELMDGFARLGPCEITEAHVYDAHHEAERRGLARPDDPGTRDEIEKALARELPRHSGHASPSSTRFVALPARGHVAETVAEFAEEERADLLVVGSRGRGAIERRFLGSVGYGLLGLASVNVLVAHERAARAKTATPPAPVAVHRILAATDFSEVGNRAVEHALALLPRGGQLTLLHVLPRPIMDSSLVPDPLGSREQGRMERALAQAELRKLIPAETQSQEIEVEVAEAHDVTQAILQAAERHDADLVVLGRRGRSGLAAVLLGSSARAVARRCPRPVLLVPEVFQRA
jgi:nucleotide-binding universal stress UspA family protein